MEKIIKPWRLTMTVLLIIALTAVFAVSLYRLQIVYGAEYYAQSENSIVTTKTVAAARGNILDRYGRVLVSNKVCNNLTINAEQLFDQQDPNSVILELVKDVEDSGNTYIDTLPITKEAPFEYVSNMTSLQKTRLQAYLKACKLPESTSAVELMAYFRKAFSIDDNYTAEQMRVIAGIRYEIKVRYVINTTEYVFAQNVSMDLITKLMENNVPGFQVESSYTRQYNTKYAAQLLGYVGMMDENEYKMYKEQGYSMDAIVGKDGVEKAFEPYLHGTDGEAVVTTTRGGTVISTKYNKEPLPGNNVYLTIDLGMNEAAENSLRDFIENTNKQRDIENKEYKIEGQTDKIKDKVSGGAVVAVNVKTGEPLCIASYPTFDPSTLQQNYSSLVSDATAPLFNRALNGTYAPGSTFKPVTAIAALDQGVITPGATIYDQGIFTKYKDQGYTPTCWAYPGTHGYVNASKAIEVSCNYYFYTVGDKLGIEKLSDYAKRFGLGQPTGIELPENTGVMATPEYKEKTEKTKWYPGDTLQAAIGQSYSVFSPLQIANYIATVANNGTRYQASILKSVRSYDYSKSIFDRTPTVADSVSVNSAYYEAVHQGMYNVANSTDGTAYSIFGNYPVKVAAKTGTAQLGEAITNNGVFVCYAPYNDPEIAVAVVVEKGYAGSAIASIAKDVLNYYFSSKNNTDGQETENSLLK